MFPERQKSALVKNKLQVIQSLEMPCANELDMLYAATMAKPKRIVIKRPPKGEFLANGVYNPIPHVRGVISMARTDVMDSASSQFFIMHETSPHLDYYYAAFGKVIKGMYVVDEICDTVKQGYNGAVAISDRPVIEYITVEKA
jgi:cyclophilin family peptidyl-prolyl cis-trans isomerase